MAEIKIIQCGNELDWVNASRKLRHLPPTKMESVCQHSCTPEQIAVCQDINCEASLVVNDGDVNDLRAEIESGNLDACKKLEIKLSADGEIMQGSLMDFLKLCTQREQENISTERRQLLAGIEQKLAWEFYRAGYDLFYQRFVDIRTGDSEKKLVLLAYETEPFLIGWSENNKWRGFGYSRDPKSGWQLDFHKYGFNFLPGDYSGPKVRIEFRVDEDVIQKVIKLCESCEETENKEAAFLNLLREILHLVGVKNIPEETQAMPFFRKLLLSIPVMQEAYY